MHYTSEDLDNSIQHCMDKVDTLKGDCQKEHYKLLMMLLDLQEYTYGGRLQSNEVLSYSYLAKLTDIRNLRKVYINKQNLITQFDLLVDNLKTIFEKVELKQECKDIKLYILYQGSEFWFDYEFVDFKLKLTLISTITTLNIKLYKKISYVLENILNISRNIKLEVI